MAGSPNQEIARANKNWPPVRDLPVLQPFVGASSYTRPHASPAHCRLAAPLRAGASSEELTRLIAEAWSARDDRGAELRLEAEGRAPWLSTKRLRDDPRLEMHTRGG